MAADLNRYLSGEPILARPVSAVERGWRWLRKNPLLATVVVGGPVLLTGTVLVVLIALLLTAVANVRLAAERQNAENRRVEAEQEREKAHARLEKAVEAVDKMLNRVGEERWATNPALQEERRQVLEDAVAFFNSFTAEDSTDPLVRKEAAKAHARVAAAYLMLGDLPKVAASAREATRLYDGLAAEFPDEPEHLAAASEVSSMVAGANSLNGEVGEALTAYTRALELADAARGKDRASAAFKLRAVQARATLGFFYLQGDRAKGEALLDPMLALAREIGTPADAKYEHRAALAFALAVAAAYDLSSPGRPSMVTARGRYDEAKAILDDLAEQPPPTARAREYFAHTRAMVATNRGLVAALLSPTADGRRPAVEQMRAGLGEYDALLRVNPKALPYRLQKYHTLRALAGLYQGLGQPAEAGKANEEAGALMDAMLADHSHLDSLRLLDATRQAYLLVRRLRGGDPFAFEPEAEKLLVLATANNKPTVVYDVACVYAVASEKRPADAERYAAKAMALLTDLAKTDYFRTPAKVAHVSGDADLKALAERDDFKAFLERVKNAPADPPKPK